jgi:hypothetical protein
MAYSEDLNAMINAIVEEDKMIMKKMFGGTCFILNGKMICGVWKDYMILRLGEVESKKAIEMQNAKVFDITGKAMKGWVMIEKEKLDYNTAKEWINLAKQFVNTIDKE